MAAATENTQVESQIQDSVLKATSTEVGDGTSDSGNMVMTQPKSKQELIAERAEKRAEKKSANRQQAEGHRRAGDILYESRNYKAALAQYIESVNIWPSDIGYHINLAAVYRKLEWYEEAAHSATRALTLDPKSSEARYLRGVARLEQRLLKPAQTDFENVLAHDSSHLRARAALTEVNQFLTSSGQLGSHELGLNPSDEATKDLDFGFPHYDDEALEIASVSDSSDCNHVGNGVPCRFYNHDGCGRGAACVYSHAPDEKSVRDELGRNVCIYYLLDNCKFGAAKCVYSHSRAALREQGWWTNPEKIAKVKAVLEVAEKQAREQRHVEQERWKAYLKSLKAAGKPPKSAGVKAKKVEKEPEESKDAKEPVATDAPVAATAAAADEKLKSSPKNKEGGKPKPRNPQRKKSKNTPASAAKAETDAPTESGTAADAPAAVPVPEAGKDGSGDKAVANSFTDYQLNEPPSGVKPPAPEASDKAAVLAY